MKFSATLAAGAAAMALAACGSAEEETPREGKYKFDVALTNLEMPGLTDQVRAQAKEQLKTSFASQAGDERCIDDGNNNNWKQAANEISSSVGGTCETVKDNGTDSTADLAITCTGTQLGDVDITMKGGAKSESFEMDIGLDIKKLPAGGEGKIDMTVSAARIGDC